MIMMSVFNSGLIAAWREVKAIFVGLSGLFVLALWWRRGWLAGLTGGLLAWIIYFFRDPVREPAADSPEFIIAPADGRIMTIRQVEEPHFIHGPAQRISIFLSLFDVHVQRAPYPGVVKRLHYQPGRFAPAFLGHAEENESNLIGLETSRGPLAVKQMTGLLARRIVCWLDLEQTLTLGQRLGLIRFGSRVDLFLPLEAELLVRAGQQVYGGETLVARW